MIIVFLAYIAGVIIVFLVQKRRKISFSSFPRMKMNKSGLIFTSHKRHRLYIGDAKIIQVGDMVYLKKNDKTVIIKNIDKLNRVENYLYFTSLGEVRIEFNASKMYKYFNIIIISEKIDMEKIKRCAYTDILNHLFNIEGCKYVRMYMNTFKLLNIEIDKKIVIKKNTLNIPYQIIYKMNNKIKKINIKS